ncbi:hypothetical protein [Carboxylicivirga linearis]|uniref:Uncharacterized protein n=1 Tax=Carboxylicivirga linearis TaxID=1628157 RepID=A0ABS5JQW7_9BACT|nr:hypothetical protein [Carboxylicivirga linearis]MBS2097285.1 hypothetical protein [Carboxylicivirga linearis]
MKFNKLYIAFLFALSTLFVGCSEWEDKVTPSPSAPEGCQGVYFPTSNQALFELEPNDEKELTLTISRTVSTGSVDVPIVVEMNTDDIFVVPSSISFADGETDVEFTITFPTAAEGVAYNLKLAVEGDAFVNPYASTIPYVETSVSRIKWEAIEEPMVYVDGTFSTFYGVSIVPMYVEAEKAQLGESVRYRFKNAYKPASGAWDGDDWVAVPDADGIYDGYYATWPGEMDESQDWYTTIEIYNPSGTSGDVFMSAHDLGVAWSYGMFSIGSIYGNLSDDLSSYPLGTLADGVITFPASSLYIKMADYNDGAESVCSTPTYIYLTKEAYIAANLKIEDYNDVEYETIEGEVGEFASAAYGDEWNQTIAKAIDADPDNVDSDYKNLYYLADLYAGGKGLAFYYEEEGSVKIPENQPTGAEVFGQEVFVSQSEDIESSVETTEKGVTVYTLGLVFHYADGTIVGEFAEKFFYSLEAVSYTKDDFIGAFTMSGVSPFGDPDADFDVMISEGTEAGTLAISGIAYSGDVIATYDKATSTISIAPQVLDDFVSGETVYDMTLYTFDGGSYYTDAPLVMRFNMSGNIVPDETSAPTGYLIRSETAGGWVDGYSDVMFEPVMETASSMMVPIYNLIARDLVSVEKSSAPISNFEIQGKRSSKQLRKSVSSTVIF